MIAVSPDHDLCAGTTASRIKRKTSLKGVIVARKLHAEPINLVSFWYTPVSARSGLMERHPETPKGAHPTLEPAESMVNAPCIKPHSSIAASP